MTSLFSTEFAQLSLQCSDKKNSPDLGWSQADHYLIRQMQEIKGYQDKEIACINDSFGALSLGIDQVQSYSDSAVSKRWIKNNAHLNQLPSPEIESIPELAHATANIYLMRLPKNLHFFKYLLSLLSQKPSATIIIAGMQKHWPASFYQAGSEFFESVDVLPGVKKAKCMVLKQGKSITDFPTTEQLDFTEFQLTCRNYPNVFAREKLDIGTRFFLQHPPELNNCKKIIDLACGNGLLGIQALQNNPQLHCQFIDESSFAIQSTADSLALNHIHKERFSLHQADVFDTIDTNEVDAILCNPPFHQQHNVSIDIAEKMIEQGAKRLKKGGHMYIVANTHLPYKSLLNKLFSCVNISNKNAKFLLYDAVK